MRIRPIGVLVLFFIAMPLAAFNRGEVYLEHRSVLFNQQMSEAWVFDSAWDHAGGFGAIPTIYKWVPYLGSEGHFFIPAPDQIVFHYEGTVSVWDGVYHWFTDPGLGYTELFHDDAELGEIAPLRPGVFLVPERSASGAKLIEFTLQGRIGDIAFPNGVGAEHIELLSDRCTLLYGVGNRVARMNICTGAALSVFAAIPGGRTVGSIRQLPNGDVLVADGSLIRQFTADGALMRIYPFEGVTHIALTPDGAEFWAAGVDAGKAMLRHFDGGTKQIPLANLADTGGESATAIDDLVVVGEWRAAAPPMRRVRATR